MNYILIIFNIVLLEILLSVDNAAVLAIMVKHLPKTQQTKALRYGILGAYLLRGLCLLLVSFLFKFAFLKVLGGAYLIYLFYAHFFKGEDAEDVVSTKWHKGLWGTILMVEIMDLAFSIDNIFAVVAMTSRIELIIVGVFIGILAMRFVAQGFVKLLNKYPELENSAYAVIGFLGIKLILNYLGFMNGHIADIFSSLFTFAAFLFPIFINYATSKSK